MLQISLTGLVTVMLVAALLAALAAVPTYFLWNWLMPSLFGLKAVTLLQAFGVNWLSATLFKSAASK